jgi:hypothetical protein
MLAGLMRTSKLPLTKAILPWMAVLSCAYAPIEKFLWNRKLAHEEGYV